MPTRNDRAAETASKSVPGTRRGLPFRLSDKGSWRVKFSLGICAGLICISIVVVMLRALIN